MSTVVYFIKYGKIILLRTRWPLSAVSSVGGGKSEHASAFADSKVAGNARRQFRPPQAVTKLSVPSIVEGLNPSKDSGCSTLHHLRWAKLAEVRTETPSAERREAPSTARCLVSSYSNVGSATAKSLLACKVVPSRKRRSAARVRGQPRTQMNGHHQFCPPQAVTKLSIPGKRQGTKNPSTRPEEHEGLAQDSQFCATSGGQNWNRIRLIGTKRKNDKTPPKAGFYLAQSIKSDIFFPEHTTYQEYGDVKGFGPKLHQRP